MPRTTRRSSSRSTPRFWAVASGTFGAASVCRPRSASRPFVDGALHPGWTWRFLTSEPIAFSNVRASGIAGAEVFDGQDPVSLSDYVNSQFDPTLSWKDLEWFQKIWHGPIVLKGVQTVEDARLAADAGVQAIALSNHGGRQLDGAPPIVELVSDVVDAVGDRVEVVCDGGVRRGSDIVKALALGARACMAGRAYLYGLGAAGEPGVDHVPGAAALRNRAIDGADRGQERGGSQS